MIFLLKFLNMTFVNSFFNSVTLSRFNIFIFYTGYIGSIDDGALGFFID
jgi:hypothetical protein